MDNKILITGATGNVGGAVLSLLRQETDNIVVAGGSGKIEGIPSVLVDYADIGSIERSLDGVSSAFMVIPTHPDMIEWGRNFLTAAKRQRVKHIVRLSTNLTKFNPELKVIEMLGGTDNDLRESGIAWTILAPQFFMQNFINFYGQDYSNGHLYLPAGSGKIGWVDIRDIAAVGVAALLNPDQYSGETLTITGGENLSYGDAIKVMNQALGKTAQYHPVSYSDAEGVMRGMGYSEFLIEFMISLNKCVVSGYTEEVSDTVENVLGRKPISFETFVSDHRSAWR